MTSLDITQHTGWSKSFNRILFTLGDVLVYTMANLVIKTGLTSLSSCLDLLLYKLTIKR